MEYCFQSTAEKEIVSQIKSQGLEIINIGFIILHIGSIFCQSLQPQYYHFFFNKCDNCPYNTPLPQQTLYWTQEEKNQNSCYPLLQLHVFCKDCWKNTGLSIHSKGHGRLNIFIVYRMTKRNEEEKTSGFQEVVLNPVNNHVAFVISTTTSKKDTEGQTTLSLKLSHYREELTDVGQISS